MITCYVCEGKFDPDKTYATAISHRKYSEVKERICRDCCFEVASGSKVVKKNERKGLMAFADVIQRDLDLAIEFPFDVME